MEMEERELDEYGGSSISPRTQRLKIKTVFKFQIHYQKMRWILLKKTQRYPTKSSVEGVRLFLRQFISYRQFLEKKC